MRKIVVFLVSTVDGYYEGPNGEFDWPVVDDEFNEFGLDQLGRADTLLFGRITYSMMAQYWPTPAAEADDPKVAEKMNSLPKVVVSTTLDRADWNNSRLIAGDVAGELARLKEQPGKDILLLGSSDLTVNLLRLGLVDEVRIMVNPVALGAGKSLFRTSGGRISLTLVDTRPFRSGNVLLTYRPTAQ
jgi:dihydrofolate reductase